MSSEDKTEVVELDGEYFRKEKKRVLNPDKIGRDFAEFGHVQTNDKRADRFLKNWTHMVLTSVTGGLYPLLYLGYYGYKFVDEFKDDSWKKTVTKFKPVNVENSEDSEKEIDNPPRK